MSEIYRKAAEVLTAGRRCVLATMVRQAGPSPRHLGTKCLILEDGTIEGTIGGGLLEARTIQTARAVFETGRPARMALSLTGRDVAETDMLCGGNVEVFLEPVLPQDPSSLALFRRLRSLVTRGGKGLLATVMDAGHWPTGTAARAFLAEGEEVIGDLGLAIGTWEALGRSIGKILDAGRPQILELVSASGASVPVFAEPLVSAPALYVFGGGHVSSEIVPLAGRCGFRVVVIDDRAEFAGAARFPSAAEVIQASFYGAMERIPVDASSFLVIVTRGHLHDKAVLAQALRTDARYIGMIGSRRKRDIIYAALLEEGYTRADLDRVHSPIGLDIGAETPAEIAVSVVAELIRERAGGGKLKD
jgi:xanthine dehydrogenase accessory factor